MATGGVWMAERGDPAPTRGGPVEEGGSVDEAAAELTFEELYAAQFTPLVRLATLLCGQVEPARDIVQDCFVELHVRWRKIDRPTAYLRRSVVNGCRSRARWERLRRGHRSDIEPAEEQPVDELGDVLARLPQRQRAAVVLKYYERRTEAEIAEILGCRPGSVGPLVTRALRSMRSELTDGESTGERSEW
jgi:RNA polymerase sigma factor (sigma-70 family)